MKIAIFENEFDTLEVAFKYLSKKHYNNSLSIKNYPRSQSVQSLEELKDYDLIIIDLDLSSLSDLDGFGLIRKIENEVINIPKVLILTGQDLEDNFDKINGLRVKYPVLEKPVNYKKLKAKFDELK